MSAEVISIVALAAMFVVATVLPINMGLLAFAAAFLVGTFAGDLTTDEILAGFPGQIFIVLVGITYLFGIAKANGTIDWLIRLAVRAVQGRIAAIPWIMFGAAATLTAVGAVSPAAVAIVAPIALGFAARYRINPLLMGVLVVHGAQAGGFSPISVYGSIVNGVVADNGLPQDEVFLFFASLAVNAAIAAVVFVAFGGLKLLGTRPDGAGAPRDVAGRPVIAGGSPELDTRLTAPTPYQALTLAGLCALVGLTLAFDLDVGFIAICIAMLLALFSPAAAKEATGQITWSVVLLICGVLTYVGVLEQIGTIEYVGDAVADVGAPLLAALLLCFIGAIVSAFASSVGVLGATIPLAVPFLLTGEVSAVGFVAALAIASTVVDVSPFSTNGALVLANAQNVDRDAFFRKLLIYGARHDARRAAARLVPVRRARHRLSLPISPWRQRDQSAPARTAAALAERRRRPRGPALRRSRADLPRARRRRELRRRRGRARRARRRLGDARDRDLRRGRRRARGRRPRDPDQPQVRRARARAHPRRRRSGAAAGRARQRAAGRGRARAARRRRHHGPGLPRARRAVARGAGDRHLHVRARPGRRRASCCRAARSRPTSTRSPRRGSGPARTCWRTGCRSSTSTG